MSEEKKSFWYRVWDHKSEKEKKRIRSFIPLILYGVFVFYGIIYLSILNTVNRFNAGATVKTWYGGDREEVVQAREKEKQEIEDSFKDYRKRVSGGR